MRLIYKNHYRTLFSLGFSIVIGQVEAIVLGFTDTLMTGHHSINEPGAVSFVNSMFILAVTFNTRFSYGPTPIVGGFYDVRKSAAAGQALRCSLLANLLVGILLIGVMAILYLNAGRLRQPGELLSPTKSYYLILLAPLIFVLLFNGLKQFTDGIAGTKAIMWILLGGNVLNIVGNYILINGEPEFPKLGLLGVGINTLFSRIIMVLVFVLVFFGSRRFLRYKLGSIRLEWSRASSRQLNALGWPVAFQMGMETASFSLSTVTVGWLGTIVLASHQVTLAILQFTFMMFYRMGTAVVVRIGNFRGQNDIINVRRTAYTGAHTILAMGIVLLSIVLFSRYQVGGRFTDNTEVSAMAVILIVPLLVYQFGDGMQINFANALRGVSDIKPMMLAAFIAYFIISLPAGYFFGLVMGWGLFGVWMVFPFGLSNVAIMSWSRFRYKTR